MKSLQPHLHSLTSLSEYRLKLTLLSQGMSLPYSSSRARTSYLLYTSISFHASIFPARHSFHMSNPENLACLSFLYLTQSLSDIYSNLLLVNPKCFLASRHVSICLNELGGCIPLRINLALSFF